MTRNIKALVEFGAKLEVSIDEEGYGRLEKVSFEAYSESGSLIEAVERYKSRTGHYPKLCRPSAEREANKKCAW